MDHERPRPSRWSQANRDFITAHPHPGNDPLARLRHVNVVCADQRPEDLAVTATQGVYLSGESTGLTNGDLRGLEALIDQLTTERNAARAEVKWTAQDLANLVDVASVQLADGCHPRDVLNMVTGALECYRDWPADLPPEQRRVPKSVPTE